MTQPAINPDALKLASAELSALVEAAKDVAANASRRHPISAQAILPHLVHAYLRALEAAEPSAPVEGVEEVEPAPKVKRNRKG